MSKSNHAKRAAKTNLYRDKYMNALLEEWEGGDWSDISGIMILGMIEYFGWEQVILDFSDHPHFQALKKAYENITYQLNEMRDVIMQEAE